MRAGEVQLLDPAAEALLGRTAPQILAEAARRAARGREVFEVDVMRRDGKRRVVEIRLQDSTWHGAPARLVDVRDATAERESAVDEELEVSAVLARAGAELNGEIDAAIVLERLCRLTTEALECRVSRAWMWQPEEQAFVPVAGAGEPALNDDERRAGRLPRWRLDGVLASLEREEVFVATRGASDPAFARVLDGIGCQGGLLAALRRDGRVAGFFLAAADSAADSYGCRAVRVAQGLARVASAAIGRAQEVADVEILQRARAEYMAAMSHELRAPLHVICGFQSLLLEGDFGAVNDEQADALRRIGKSAGQLLELIDNTLNLNRIEAGRLAVELRDVAAADVLGEVELETRDMRAASSLESVWKIPEGLPRVRTDPQKLKLVLRNLIGNALKYTDQGKVTVSARPCSDGVEFSVADTGIGIEPSALRSIFEPFRQLREGTRDRGGVGLGLHIVQRMLEMVGGAIRVDSRVGEGSTFRVWVPAAAG